MNKMKYQCVRALICLIAMVIVSGSAYAQSEEIVLIGEINDTHQLVAEDEIFDIDDTSLGDDLAENYISMKVRVTGTVKPGDELRIIRVKTFEVVEE